MSELEITYRPISELKPWPNNPRTHSDDQVALLVASMQEYGFTNPVLVDETDTILAGHGRIEAAGLAGLEQVPTLLIDGLTQEQKRAYVIADNKMALNADWDLDALEKEITALAEAEFDLDLTGFAEHELKRLMEGESERQGEGEDKFKEPIIQYNIIFDDEGQQERWYQFVRHVREQFSAETFAEALDEWVKHHVELD